MKKQQKWIISTLGLVILGFAVFTFVSIKSLSQQAPSRSTISTVSDISLSNRPMPIVVDPKIPRQIYSCMIPKADQISLINKGEKVVTIEFINQVTDQQKQTFYYLEVTTAKNNLDTVKDSFYPLVKLDSNKKCKALHSEDEVAPFSYYIPLEVARQLELKLVKQEIINAGGKKKYQQQLIDGNISGEGLLLLSKEKEWALRQLSISIPSNSIIFDKPYSRSKGSPF